jgi:DNA-directed RNA polymerase subunit RPC12/RpoP
MAINVRYTCGRSFRVPETAVGKTLRCKTCNARIPVTRKRRSNKPKSRPADDDDNLLNQLFDDDEDYNEDYEDYEAADSHREASSPPPIRRRRKQFPVTPARRRLNVNWAKLAALFLTASLLVMMVSAVMISPLLAMLVAKALGGISVILLLAGGIWGLCIAAQEEHLLLCFFIPFYLLIFVVTHIDEARGPIYCFGGGIFITGAIKLLDMWMIARHGISVM